MGRFDTTGIESFRKDTLKGFENFVNAARVNELLKKKDRRNTLIIILSVIGAVIAIAGIAFALYKFFTPNYLEDFEDDVEDDFDDDYFDDDDDIEE